MKEIGTLTYTIKITGIGNGWRIRILAFIAKLLGIILTIQLVQVEK